jgi:type I restriction enzyme S subunit
MNYKLSDCADLVRDTVNPKSLPKPVRYVGLEHINEQDLSLNGHGWSTDVDSNKYQFKKGDILFGKLRPYFRKAIITEFDGICSTDIWVIRPKENQDLNYLYYWVSSIEFVETVNRASEGTRMPRAKWSIAGELKKTSMF